MKEQIFLGSLVSGVRGLFKAVETASYTMGWELYSGFSSSRMSITSTDSDNSAECSWHQCKDDTASSRILVIKSVKIT